MALIRISALTTYLHDLWMHTFVTAKYWGRGPLTWTRDMISKMTLKPLVPLSSTSHDEPIILPTQHCRWVIHVDKKQTITSDLQDYQKPSNFDQSSWMSWPSAEQSSRSFVQSTQESVSENTFTCLSPDDLPISSSLIVESIGKDSNSLVLESLRFAIMGGNLELVASLLSKPNRKIICDYLDRKEFHPYHLAATYLDGGNTCCSMFLELFAELDEGYPIFRFNEDSMHHTVLDCLVISVIRSHTNVSPRDVSPSFADTAMYPGEEKDACGRWDADSPAIRQLFQRGSYRIPPSWKHPFCHSSVQAVCHCLIAIFKPGGDISHIKHLSGLFIRYCNKCGAKLTLGTLHLVVILAYHLAASGIQGETLFGTVAMLVCLLRLGADVSQKSEVSIHEILGLGSEDMCQHANIDAGDFMQTVPSATVDLWTQECQTGWHCMHGILKLAKNSRIRPMNNAAAMHDHETGRRSTFGRQVGVMDIDNDEILNGQRGLYRNLTNNDDDDDDDDEFYCILAHEHKWYPAFPCGNPQLGLIWAVIQAEMLTYRKILDIDHWISDNFSMNALREWLEGESKGLEMPFVQEDMLKEFAVCGWFIGNRNSHFLPIADEVTKQHIMNMDMHGMYHRTSFQVQNFFF